MRIAGVTIPNEKHAVIALTEVYGVGRSLAADILEELGIDETVKPKDFTPEQEQQIREKVESFAIEGDLRRQRSQNIKRLKDIRAYRGTRHERNLPSRGQRTKTNSRTVRGNVRKTMGSGRRKIEKT